MPGGPCAFLAAPARAGRRAAAPALSWCGPCAGLEATPATGNVAGLRTVATTAGDGFPARWRMPARSGDRRAAVRSRSAGGQPRSCARSSPFTLTCGQNVGYSWRSCPCEHGHARELLMYGVLRITSSLVRAARSLRPGAADTRRAGFLPLRRPASRLAGRYDVVTPTHPTPGVGGRGKAAGQVVCSGPGIGQNRPRLCPEWPVRPGRVEQDSRARGAREKMETRCQRSSSWSARVGRTR